MAAMKRERASRKGAYDIICPLIPGKGKPLVRVTIRSPKRHRKAVYVFAAHFRREFGYDFVPYGLCGNETDPNHVAFLRVAPEFTDLFFGSTWLVPCVGACCFRKWKDWTMQFAWLHPYFRRRQLLTAAWPQFEQEFGRFKLEPPLSPEMKAAVRKFRPEEGGADGIAT